MVLRRGVVNTLVFSLLFLVLLTATAGADGPQTISTPAPSAAVPAPASTGLPQPAGSARGLPLTLDELLRNDDPRFYPIDPNSGDSKVLRPTFWATSGGTALVLTGNFARGASQGWAAFPGLTPEQAAAWLQGAASRNSVVSLGEAAAMDSGAITASANLRLAYAYDTGYAGAGSISSQGTALAAGATIGAMIFITKLDDCRNDPQCAESSKIVHFVNGVSAAQDKVNAEIDSALEMHFPTLNAALKAWSELSEQYPMMMIAL